MPTSTIDAVHARAAWLDVAAGEEVTRRWESDRFFYIVLSGRYDIRGARSEAHLADLEPVNGRKYHG